MTIVASVCERWALEMEPATDENDRWFLDWVLESPSQVSKHLTAGMLAYQSVADAYPGLLWPSAVEYFGGIGAQALMVRSIFKPREHTVQDFSQASAAHLARALPNDIRVRQADAYSLDSYVPASLVGLDFGDLTVRKMEPDDPRRELLDRVFGGYPRGVVLTDIAGPRLHLHQKLYGSILGPEAVKTYPDYLSAVSDRINRLYGYRLTGGFYHRWSAVLGFVPEGMPAFGILKPVPEKPVGLELL